MIRFINTLFITTLFLFFERLLHKNAPSQEPKRNEKAKMFDPNERGARYEETQTEQLGWMSAHMLMTLLYSIRMARYDLHRNVQGLSKRMTRWDPKCDRRLHKLMCYVNSTLDYKMVGWIGDDPSELTAHLFCDADFAGETSTRKSTSGLLIKFAGRPIHWSKKLFFYYSPKFSSC